MKSISGTYQFPQGAAKIISSRMSFEKEATSNTRHNLKQPVMTISTDVLRDSNDLSIVLRVDVDGQDPLEVVSGVVFDARSNRVIEFIGRVVDKNNSGQKLKLEVDDFIFSWPQSGHLIDFITLEISEDDEETNAKIVFESRGSSKKFGAYPLRRTSPYFREIEFEIDREDGAVDVKTYNTHTHPDRPSDLKKEDLTIESTFARSGLKITSSSNNNVIETSEAGVNKRWSYQELHDAMEKHWSSFENKPQWKMWIFLAELADSDGLGGVMFDGDINEPGGVDRQGTALFTKSPYFHTVDGAYIKANPPKEEAVKRELFFNLIHESGHAFNLAHSFQKSLGSPWSAPYWMPLKTDPKSLSWMNYPDSASPNPPAAKWFYDRFRFRFDEGENLYLRHAPERFVQFGNEDWFVNHGRCSLDHLDSHLEMIMRSPKQLFELGEPINVEVRLRNLSKDHIKVHTNLDLEDGFLEVAITDPNGIRKPFIPIAQTRSRMNIVELAHEDRLYQNINVTIGKNGFHFKEPGSYRIEATYQGVDGKMAAAILQVWIKPTPNFDDLPIISDIYEARLGRVLYFGGSREMEDSNEKLNWISNKLGKNHPIQYHLLTTLANPKSKTFKSFSTDQMAILEQEPDPEYVVNQLNPIIDKPENFAKNMGNILTKQIIDMYTDSAVDLKQSSKAKAAQSTMLTMFKKNNVVENVINDISERIKKL